MRWCSEGFGAVSHGAESHSWDPQHLLKRILQGCHFTGEGFV